MLRTVGKRLKPGSPSIAVAYLRASKDEQKLSPEAQRATIESWAARERIQVVAWYIDQGVRSITPLDDRPALVAAFGALGEHGAGVLVVARRDRIARDVMISASFEHAVEKRGARVVSAAGEGNGDQPADQFMRTVIDGAAQYERALIRARTKAALKAKKVKGERISGAVPYGYALDEDGVHLVRLESEQETIARCLALANGRTLGAVATELAREGKLSRAGKPFLPTQIMRMIARAS
jgi:site-specific DNA recombinase